MNVQTIRAAYTITETYEGPNPEGPFRNMDLVSPRTWLRVTLTPGCRLVATAALALLLGPAGALPYLWAPEAGS